jgi:hypothetical protein
MPNNIGQAAQWWIGMQKPMVHEEQPRLVGDNWETPYTRRICYNLGKFLTMKSNDQDYIIGGTGDGVWWNGDDMPMYYRIYEEHMVMKDVGIDKYRQRAMKAARGLIKKP